MASKADGSVVIDVDLSVTQAEKNLQKLKQKIEKTEAEIAELTEKRDKAREEGIFKAGVLDEEKRKLQEIKDRLKEAQFIASKKSTGKEEKELYKTDIIPHIREELSEQSKRVSLLQTEWNRVENSVEKYIVKLEKSGKKLDEQKAEAGQLVQEIDRANSAEAKFFGGTKTAEELFDKLEKRISGLAVRAFVFTTIASGLRSMRDWLWETVKTNDEARQSVARLEGALLTLVQPLVEVIIPAFVALVNVVTSAVTTLAALTSAIFAETIESSAEAAENLQNEKDALQGVGEEAKKARKALASFDEINRLTSGNTSSNSAASNDIKPDFSWLKDNDKEFSLTFLLKDLLFKWDNLDGEDIISKIVAGLNTVAGAVVGFSVGGPAGAAIGAAAGMLLSLFLLDTIFDWNGKITEEEIFKLLLDGLNSLGGALIGFAAGGPAGAALGLLVGSGVSLLLNKLIFDNDGTMSKEELLQSIITSLLELAGGILGFAAGGPAGAAIGVTIAAGAAAELCKLIFNTDGVLSKEEVGSTLTTALGAIVGGIIGFSLGGPGGALIGLAIGAGATGNLMGLIFKGSGEVDTDTVGTLVSALNIAAGTAIGFVLGGPGGALIGAGIGVGASLGLLTTVFDWSGKQALDTILELLKDALYIACGGLIGFVIGGPAGAVFGMVIGGALRMHLDNLDFDKDIEDSAKNTAQKAITLALTTILGALVGAAFGGGVFGGIVGGTIGLIFGLSVVFDKADIKDNSGLNGGKSAGTGGAGRTTRGAVEPALTGFGDSLTDIPIPALATGAVIPPNREFMAILGDQTSGTNIETPENLLRQIIREENSDYSSILRDILQAIRDGKVLMVDNDIFAQVVRDADQRESDRQGIPMVTVR